MAVVLIRKPVLDAIAAGEITLLFRRWERPRVRVGGTHRTAVGVLEVLAVEPVAAARLTAADARAGGFPTVAALRAAQTGTGRLYRITVRLAGEDPRIALRSSADLSDDDRAAIATRLARMDASSRTGPWTTTVLRLIAENPGVRAPDLAERLGRETQPFKRDVRKLKELGLTESLEVGYRISPRGRAWLDGP
ncbi:winged helix-turn-helix domain-containing protein [Pseudonocardia saturnea]